MGDMLRKRFVLLTYMLLFCIFTFTVLAYYAFFGTIPVALFWVGFGGLFVVLLGLFCSCYERGLRGSSVGLLLLMAYVTFQLRSLIPILRFPDSLALDYSLANEYQSIKVLENAPWDPSVPRLLKYPAGFVENLILERVSGIDTQTLIFYGTTLATPIFLLGFFILARIVMKSDTRTLFALVALMCLPFIRLGNLFYEGLAYALVPYGIYLLMSNISVRNYRRILMFMTITISITLTHLATSISFVAIIAAIGIAASLARRAGHGDTNSGYVKAIAFSSFFVVSWLVYVSASYIREGRALLMGIYDTFSGELGSPGGGELVSPLTTSQLAFLVISVVIISILLLAALTDFWRRLQRHEECRTHFLAIIPMILLLIPAGVVFFVPLSETGIQESLKEFKVRFFLFAAMFISFSLVLGIASIRTCRVAGIRRKVLLTMMLLPLFVNSITLPLVAFGGHPSDIYSDARVVFAEDPRLRTPDIYMYGFWIGASINHEQVIVSSHTEAIYIIGYGGFDTSQVVTWTFDPYENPHNTTSWLLAHGIEYISVDRELTEYPSLYWDKKIADSTIVAFESNPMLDAVYENGRNVLFVFPSK